VNSPLVESRIRDIQSRAAERRQKREEAAADLAERRANEEQRTCVRRDQELAAAHKAACEFWDNFYKQEQERERQRKIKKANPTLIKLKADYMIESNSNRRVQLVKEFVDLYKSSYGKAVDVNALAKEWDDLRRKAFLARIYGTTR
jgi:uncharacterized protein YdiU (UPF0061 family)